MSLDKISMPRGSVWSELSQRYKADAGFDNYEIKLSKN